MTQRAAYPAQDFQKMCKQAERDQETKKLVVLIERVKRQLQERETAQVTEPKRPVAALVSDGTGSRAPSRTAIFER